MEPSSLMSAMECNICFMTYNLKIFPVIGRCGHSICQKCVKRLPESNCPICRHRDAFDSAPKNYLASDMIRKILADSPGGPEKINEIDKLIQRIQEVKGMIEEERKNVEAERIEKWKRMKRHFQQRENLLETTSREVLQRNAEPLRHISHNISTQLPGIPENGVLHTTTHPVQYIQRAAVPHNYGIFPQQYYQQLAQPINIYPVIPLPSIMMIPTYPVPVLNYALQGLLPLYNIF